MGKYNTKSCNVNLHRNEVYQGRLALLLAATEGPADAEGEGSVQVILNGKAAQRVEISNENSDVVHLVVLSDAVRQRANDLRLEVKAGKSVRFQPVHQSAPHSCQVRMGVGRHA